jgi:xanthine dehydrogenase YagT iron-sulfur-binding subunit
MGHRRHGQPESQGHRKHSQPESQGHRKHSQPESQGHRKHTPDSQGHRRHRGQTTSDVSRRDFFKTIGAGSIATAVVAGVRDVEAQGPAPIGPAEVPITLTINGLRHQLSVEPRVTLLDAMRTRLDITGPKRVCDRGACGACTVIIEPPGDAKSASLGAGGRTYYSCSMLAIEAQGRNIRTVDGLATGNTLHPVQQAFCDNDGLMCGFCTPGFVMSTVALLEKNPNPTPEQAKKALDGNLCRCGTNIGVLKAALAAKGGARG